MVHSRKNNYDLNKGSIYFQVKANYIWSNYLILLDYYNTLQSNQYTYIEKIKNYQDIYFSQYKCLLCTIQSKR